MKTKFLLPMLALFFFALSPGRATTYVFTNYLDNHWSYSLNWSPHGVPGPNDTAVISSDGGNFGYIVVLDVNPSVNNLVVGGDPDCLTGYGNLYLAGHTLTVSGTVQMNGCSSFYFGGGTLVGKPGATLAGQFVVPDGGYITGSLTIATNGILTLASGADHNFPSCALTNYGTVNWPLGRIRTGGVPGTLFANYGIWDCQGDQTFNTDFGGDGGSIINFGTFRKSASTNSTSVTIPFSSTGIVDVQNGAMVMSAGAVFSGGQLTGAGLLYLNGGGIQFDNPQIGGNVQMAGGALYGANTINGTLNWSSGVWNTGDSITVMSNSILNITSGADHDLSAVTFYNYGTVNWSGGRIRGGGIPGTTINNYGIWDAQLDQVFNSDFGGVGMTFNNFSTLIKSGGTGATSFNSVSFYNSGTLNIATGALNLPTGGVFDGGNITGPGALNLIGGGFNVNAVSLGTNCWLYGGGLYGANVLNGIFYWYAGSWNSVDSITLSTNSTVVVLSAADHDLGGTTLTNNGTVTWLNGRIRGGGIPLTTVINNGLWDCESDQPVNNDFGGNGFNFINSGTLRKSASAGTTTLAGGVSLNTTGLVDVQSGGLALSGGGNGGTFFAQTNTAISFNNGFNFVSGATFNGQGGYYLNGGAFTTAGILNFSNLQQSGGTLYGANIQINGIFNWIAGTWNGAGAVTISTNSQLLITSGNDHDMASCTITNFGTVTWTGGRIRGGAAPGSFVQNFGLWDCQSDQPINSDLGANSWVFYNFGTFRKSASSGTTTITSGYGPATFRSTGTVDVQGGALTLNGGALFTGGAVTGAGGVYLAAGNFTLINTLLGTNVTQTGGALAGKNVLNNTFTWYGGNWNSAQQVLVPANSVLNIVSGNDHDLANCTLTNSGTVNWSNGRIRGGGNPGTRIFNLGLWDSQADLTFNSDLGVYGLTITNSGTFRKSGGSGSTTVAASYGAPTLTSSGVVDIQTGNLNLTGGANFTGGLVTNSGAVYFSSGNFNVKNTRFSASVIQTGGSLVGSNSLDGNFNWYGGYWGGNSVTVTSNTDLFITSGNDHNLPSSTLVNLGRVQWQGGRIRGGSNPGTTISNLGLWDCQTDQQFNSDYGLNGMVFNNQGVYRKSAGTGTTTFDAGGSTLSAFNNNAGSMEIFSGTVAMPAGFSLAGAQLTIAIGGASAGQWGQLVTGFTSFGIAPGHLTIFYTNNFTPTAGTIFPLISAPYIGYLYNNYYLPATLPPLTALQNYTNSIALLVTGNLSPLTAGSANGIFSLAFQTFSNFDYTVRGNFDLATTNWFVITNFTGDGSLRQFNFPESNAPAEFFRVSSP